MTLFVILCPVNVMFVPLCHSAMPNLYPQLINHTCSCPYLRTPLTTHLCQIVKPLTEVDIQCFIHCLVWSFRLDLTPALWNPWSACSLSALVLPLWCNFSFWPIDLDSRLALQICLWISDFPCLTPTSALEPRFWITALTRLTIALSCSCSSSSDFDIILPNFLGWSPPNLLEKTGPSARGCMPSYF